MSEDLIQDLQRDTSNLNIKKGLQEKKMYVYTYLYTMTPIRNTV